MIVLKTFFSNFFDRVQLFSRNIHLVEWVPDFGLKKVVWRAESSFFNTLRLFRKINFEEKINSKMGFLMFRVREKAVFESYMYYFGYFSAL